MAVTIEQIKELREATGVSMSACKSALEEAGGNFDEAINILRKKGEAKAVSRAGRETSNGVVSVKVSDGKASMVKLLCETDFVSKGDGFIDLADILANKLFTGELSQSDRDNQDIKDAILKMGENIVIGDMQLLEGDVIGAYVHSNKKIGVLVVLNGGSADLARDVAMHVAALNPSVISPSEISDDLVSSEKAIWREQLLKEGKPEAILENIMIGKEKKFREENALLKQQFVKDPTKTIEDLLKEQNAEVVSFVRFEI